MPKDLNRVNLIGNVGKEPEVSYLADQTCILSFSLATHFRFKSRTDEWCDTTEWHNIEARGKMAERLCEVVKAGMKLSIEGFLSTSSWEDPKCKKKHYRCVVRVQDYQCISSISFNEQLPAADPDQEVQGDDQYLG